MWLLLSGASIIESDYLLLKRPPCWMRPASLSYSVVSSWPQGVNLHVTHKPPESPPQPNSRSVGRFPQSDLVHK